jgi:hypothetical protein
MFRAVGRPVLEGGRRNGMLSTAMVGWSVKIEECVGYEAQRGV